MATIAIIGGGVSGLSAGIYAQLHGHRATVYERHAKAGGNLTGWDREGYHIDNCIHWLTGTNPVTDTYRMWQDLGVLGEVEVYQAEALYTYEERGKRLSLSKSIDKLEADMLKLSPADKREILALTAAVRACMRLSGIAGKANDKKSTAAQRLLALPSLVRYYSMTTGELAARFTHPLLQGFLKSILTDRFGALALIVVFATFCGGNGGIPVGSSSAMAERLARRFLSLGGSLRLSTGVAKINLGEKGAESLTLEDGSLERADYVIIATDPAVAFGKLVERRLMPKALSRQYQTFGLFRFSSVHAAFACEKKPPFKGDLIVELPRKYQRVLGGEHIILREFSHEKGFAPRGKHLVQAMVYCTEPRARGFIALYKNKKAYTAKKQQLAADIERAIEEKLPILSGALSCLDVWTPATYQKFVGSEMGSWMGFAFSSGILPTRLSARVKGVENLLLATQWLQAPGGLPIAAGGGREAIRTLLKIEEAKRAALGKRRSALPENPLPIA